MRKFTMSILMLLVSVFFIGQTALGQAMHSKTVDVAESTNPVVQVVKGSDASDFADMYSIDFDAEVAFTFDFMPWTVNDVDMLPTYGMTGIDWPNAGDPQAFIVFNPDETTPPIEGDPEILPYSGTQFGACLASVPDGANGNDDWFISDMVNVGNGSSFNFMARSYTDEWGLERFNVAVSTTTNDPADFTVISGATYIEAPMAWTPYTFDLSMYSGQDIYVAIQCVTYDAFIFMIDDLVIDPGAEPSMCDTFDELMPGDYVAVELPNWTTWSNLPGSAEDGMVTDVVSASPLNSFVVEGTTDLVHLLGPANITAGMYYYANKMYVADGFCGYFNLQKDIVPGVEWGFQVQFDVDGTATCDAGAAAAGVFPFTFDEWHTNELYIDLNGDLAEYWFDGVLIVSWPWSLGTFGTAGAMTLGGANYYAWASAGNDPLCYFDDVCFEELLIDPCENFDALIAGGYVADQLGGYWTTWSGTPGSAEDAMVSDAQSLSPDNSFVVDAGTIDLIFQFGDDPIVDGQWMYSHWMYVPTGFSGYFNVQSDPAPGVDWNVELYFDDGGTGSFAGQATGDFTYTQDTWFQVIVNYDLDAGLAEVYFDDVFMIQFVNEMTIGSIDYYGSNSGGDPGAFYDDVCFGEGWPISTADCEDFDALTSGGYVADQLGGYWTTWSGAPGGPEDGIVSDLYANSDPNSFVVNAGTIDLIFQFGDDPIATGQWLYSHYIYVPTGFSGYFNVQSEPAPGVDWNVELYFDDGGTGSFAGQASGDFTYDQDTWIFVEVNYDLDAGLAQVLFDEVLVAEFVNAMTIGSIDYYGSNSGGDPGAYYDDVCFGPGWVITSIEEPVVTANSVVYPNPATDKITIASKNIIDEVRIYNNMGQLVYSGQFDNSQIMVNTSAFISGMYIVQITSDEAVEVRKLIIE